MYFRNILFFAASVSACTLLSLSVASQAQSQEKQAGDPSPPAAATPGLPLYPLDIAVDNSGVAYVVDRNLPGVWQRKDDQLSVLFQASKKYRTPLNAARSVALDHEGNLLVGDSSTRDVYRISAEGEATPITNGNIGIPMDLAVSSDGTIYVADLELRTLVKIPAGTNRVEQVAPVNPRGVFVDSRDQVWVVSQNAEQLQIIGDDGKAKVVVGERTFEFPHQVVVKKNGDAFVSDGYKKAIWKVPSGGKPEVWIEGTPLDNPVGISLVDDQLVIVDPRVRKVFRATEDRKLTEWFELKR